MTRLPDSEQVKVNPIQLNPSHHGQSPLVTRQHNQTLCLNAKIHPADSVHNVATSWPSWQEEGPASWPTKSSEYPPPRWNSFEPFWDHLFPPSQVPRLLQHLPHSGLWYRVWPRVSAPGMRLLRVLLLILCTPGRWYQVWPRVPASGMRLLRGLLLILRTVGFPTFCDYDQPSRATLRSVPA